MMITYDIHCCCRHESSCLEFELSGYKVTALHHELNVLSILYIVKGSDNTALSHIQTIDITAHEQDAVSSVGKLVWQFCKSHNYSYLVFLNYTFYSVYGTLSVCKNNME